MSNSSQKQSQPSQQPPKSSSTINKVSAPKPLKIRIYDFAHRTTIFVLVSLTMVTAVQASVLFYKKWNDPARKARKPPPLYSGPPKPYNEKVEQTSPKSKIFDNSENSK